MKAKWQKLKTLSLKTSEPSKKMKKSANKYLGEEKYRKPAAKISSVKAQ
jgi:hypothetical protein